VLTGSSKLPVDFPSDVPTITDKDFKLIAAAKSKDEKSGKNKFVISYKAEKADADKVYASYASDLKAKGWALQNESLYKDLNTIKAVKGLRQINVTMGGSSGENVGLNGFVVNIIIND
jgi:23S rRNA pseudoU1915 N3-methylase RlmH